VLELYHSLISRVRQRTKTDITSSIGETSFSHRIMSVRPLMNRATTSSKIWLPTGYVNVKTLDWWRKQPSSQRIQHILLFFTKYLEVCLGKRRNKMWKQPNFCLFTPWRHVKGVEAQLHSFLNSSLHGNGLLISRPGRFALGKEPPPYPLNKRLGGTHSRSGRFAEEKNLLPLQGIETPAVQQTVCFQICNCSQKI
jgi:hypothetical protein